MIEYNLSNQILIIKFEPVVFNNSNWKTFPTEVPQHMYTGSLFLIILWIAVWGQSAFCLLSFCENYSDEWKLSSSYQFVIREHQHSLFICNSTALELIRHNSASQEVCVVHIHVCMTESFTHLVLVCQTLVGCEYEYNVWFSWCRCVVHTCMFQLVPGFKRMGSLHTLAGQPTQKEIRWKNSLNLNRINALVF